jgi:ABC-type glycerol-3-phosphate transport system permease component
MTTSYIITFYTVIVALVLASFIIGYTLARQKFPYAKSRNRGNTNE